MVERKEKTRKEKLRFLFYMKKKLLEIDNF